MKWKTARAKPEGSGGRPEHTSNGNKASLCGGVGRHPQAVRAGKCAGGGFLDVGF